MFQKILIIVNLVVALAGVGVVFYSHHILKPEPTDQLAEIETLKQQATEANQLRPVPIKKFVVNLHSQSNRLRYLDLEMNILTFKQEQMELIKESEHILKDIVVELASHLTPEDLESVTGKILLENRIKKKVNARLGDPPTIKQIYFSGFVVQ
jgi:flagellar FliL protein